MKRTVGMLMLVVGMVSASLGVSVIDADFTSPDYSDGDLAGQQSWAEMQLSWPKAFSVDAAAGVAATAPYAGSFNPTNGNHVYLNSSLGNAAADEWDGTVDFKLSTTPMAGVTNNDENVANIGNVHSVYDIGLTRSDTTNYLNTTQGEDIALVVRVENPGGLVVQFSGNNVIADSFSMDDAGWDPENSNAAGADFETDTIRMTWNLRKTTIDQTYKGTAVLSNLTTAAVSTFSLADADNFTTKSNLYASASVFLAMGHNASADRNGTDISPNESLVDIAIESLIVDQSSGVAAVLTAPALTAEGSDQTVELSWKGDPEATGYTVKRSSVEGGPYSTTVGTTNGTGMVDTAGLVNGQLYYYIVTASRAGSADVDSNEAIGEPNTAVTGTILDDVHFTTTEGFANNIDLAGQQGWRAAANTGPQAFMVTDADGAGYADTEPYEASFKPSLSDGDAFGNYVYLNKLMSNNVGDEWTGSTTLQLKIDPLPGQWVTNIVEGVTNIAETATIVAHQSPYAWGLTTEVDKDNALRDQAGESHDALMLIRLNSEGQIYVNFGGNFLANQQMVALTPAQAGWDPSWAVTTNAAPDFETDPMTIDWKFRKTLDAGVYYGEASVTIGGTTYANAVSGYYLSNTMEDLYPAELARFSMGHYRRAGEGGTIINVAIDALSLTKADSQPPQLAAPGTVSGEGSDTTAIISWFAGTEVSSYSVYRAYDNDGAYTQLTNGLTELTYTDTDGLVNGTTYFYKVASDYGIYGEVLSDWVPVRPLGRGAAAQWGPSGAIVTTSVNPTFAETQVPTAGGTIEFRIGNGVDGTMWTDGVGTYNMNVVPSLWGISQLFQLPGSSINPYNWQMRNSAPFDYVRLRTKDQTDAAVEVHSVLIWTETGGGVNLTGQSASFDLSLQGIALGGPVHAALRNGASDWYVSQSGITSAGPLEIPDVGSELWAPLVAATSTSTNMMTVIGASFAAAPAFNDVQAVGFFHDNGRNTHVDSFRLVVGEQPTTMQLWTDSQGIYNADAAADADPDMDGVDNIYEWGLFGDPADPASKGQAPQYAGVDATGTNILFVTPRKMNEPKPVYTVMETPYLLYGAAWTNNSGTYVETGIGPNLGGSFGEYKWVTNAIPTDIDVKFIGLNVQEP
ncbi:fibronectin type III domain-containing protein [Pontiella sulfatireligans]|uniref:Fibronectin type-III domain-containing protein n=1 Tax=Pontiella sulfatireligans TaxID=2750658 RepID=A0A6C2UCW3_9BACT|nr:hypothetical protein [Pontiella sulfatireligans]VGO18032.1 hypothetical protein SCARR_00082 [Pontiella sulfatireligans]